MVSFSKTFLCVPTIVRYATIGKPDCDQVYSEFGLVCHSPKTQRKILMAEFPSSRWRGDRALLIFDMVEDAIHGPDSIEGAQDCIRFIDGELRYFRERDRSVIFLSTLCHGASPSPFIDELLPRSNETVIHKPGPDAFFQTELHETLARLKVKRLTMTGIGASSSILITAAAAMSRGYSVAAPEPCVVDENLQNRELALHIIRNVWSPVESPASILPMAGAAAS